MRPHLNRRLTLEAPTRTPDAAGGYSTAWSALGTLWAEVAPDLARLDAVPGGATARARLRVTVRAAPPGAPARPQAGQRFREGLRLFPIDAVQEADPTGRHLLCLAHEEASR